MAPLSDGHEPIRRFSAELDPELERYFVLPTTDDGASTLATTGIPRSRWQWSLGMSGMIGIINSLVAGVLGGLTVYWLGVATTVLPWAAGAAAFAVSSALLRAMSMRSLRAREAISPESPAYPVAR